MSKCDMEITFNVNFYFCKLFRIWKITHISSLKKIYPNMTLNKYNNKNIQFYNILIYIIKF